jgi:hypothetical protein
MRYWGNDFYDRAYGRMIAGIFGYATHIMKDYENGIVYTYGDQSQFDLDQISRIAQEAIVKQQEKDSAPLWKNKLSMPYDTNIWYHTTHLKNLYGIANEGLRPAS